MTESTVVAGVVSTLLELAVSRGADRATLLARAGLELANLREREARVPLERYVALLRAGKEMCGDPALALHFGEAALLTDMTVGLAAGGYAGSLQESLRLTNRYASLVVDVGGPESGARFELQPEGDRIWFVDRRPRPNAFPELTESTFARIATTSGSLFGERYTIHAAHFTHAQPPYVGEYQRIFRAPLTFESDRNALLTDASWWSSPAPFASRPVFEALRSQSESLLKRLEATRTLRGRVEAALLSSLPAWDVGAAGIARLLGLSRQTLFRRLRVEGTTFEQVRDDLRCRLAREHLAEPGATVGEVAYHLGFSEPAAFSRAFKRWTGESPAAAVKRNAERTRGE